MYYQCLDRIIISCYMRAYIAWCMYWYQRYRYIYLLENAVNIITDRLAETGSENNNYFRMSSCCKILYTLYKVICSTEYCSVLTKRT